MALSSTQLTRVQRRKSKEGGGDKGGTTSGCFGYFPLLRCVSGFLWFWGGPKLPSDL